MTIKEMLMPLYLAIVNNEIRFKVGNLLDNRLIETKYVYVSMWSFVHFFVGGLIYFILDKFIKIKSTKVRFLILFTLLLGYEFIEYFLYMNLSLLFIPETPVDVVWDLIIGMSSGFIVYLCRRGAK